MRSSRRYHPVPPLRQLEAALPFLRAVPPPPPLSPVLPPLPPPPSPPKDKGLRQLSAQVPPASNVGFSGSLRLPRPATPLLVSDTPAPFKTWIPNGWHFFASPPPVPVSDASLKAAKILACPWSVASLGIQNPTMASFSSFWPFRLSPPHVLTSKAWRYGARFFSSQVATSLGALKRSSIAARSKAPWIPPRGTATEVARVGLDLGTTQLAVQGGRVPPPPL